MGVIISSYCLWLVKKGKSFSGGKMLKMYVSSLVNFKTTIMTYTVFQGNAHCCEWGGSSHLLNTRLLSWLISWATARWEITLSGSKMVRMAGNPGVSVADHQCSFHNSTTTVDLGLVKLRILFWLCSTPGVLLSFFIQDSFKYLKAEVKEGKYNFNLYIKNVIWFLFLDVWKSWSQCSLLILFLIFHRIYYMTNTCHSSLSANIFIWKLIKLSWFDWD